MNRICGAPFVCAMALAASFAFADEGKNPVASDDAEIAKLQNDYADAQRAMPPAAPAVLFCLALTADQEAKLKPADRVLNDEMLGLLDAAGVAFLRWSNAWQELEPMMNRDTLKDSKVRVKAAALIAKMRGYADTTAQNLGQLAEQIPPPARIQRWEDGAAQDEKK